MPEFVHMHHPEVDACAEAPREAFDAVWAEKGWAEADQHEDQTVLREELPPEMRRPDEQAYDPELGLKNTGGSD